MERSANLQPPSENRVHPSKHTNSIEAMRSIGKPVLPSLNCEELQTEPSAPADQSHVVSSSSSSSSEQEHCSTLHRASNLAPTFFTTMITAVAVLQLPIAHCLLTPIQRLPMHTSCNGRSSTTPFACPTYPSRRILSSSSSSPTSLHLFFDKFLHPYGVSPTNQTNNNSSNNNNDDEANQTDVELLQALLPRLLSKEETDEEKARLREAFHRERLKEQLRILKQGNGIMEQVNAANAAASSGEEGNYLADDEDQVLRMSELFQRNRLAEQLRLSRLQKKQFINTLDSIEMARGEYESEMEREEEGGSGATGGNVLVMTEESDGEVKEGNNVDDSVQSDDGGSLSSFDSTANKIVRSGGGDNGGGSDAVLSASSNATHESTSLSDLQNKLEKLHQMVKSSTAASAQPITTSTALALHPSSTSIALPNSNMTSSTTSKQRSIQHFLSTTHLPLPPREDAPVLSLLLAPFAYLLTAMVLLGTSIFYAIVALLDVLWNDDVDVGKNYSTKTCLNQAGYVWRGCWCHLFVRTSSGEKEHERQRDGGWPQRSLEAIQTSFVALFYTVQCILLRAWQHSNYATESLDAGTESLRYLVFAVRSIDVVWKRFVNWLSLKRANNNAEIAAINDQTTRVEGKRKLNPWTRTFHLLRVVSSIRKATAERLNQQRSLQTKQQRLRSEREYQEKMRSLNQDRVMLEREQRELFDAQRQLEVDRRNLLCEGVGVLAWYSSAKEAEATALLNSGAVKEEHENRKRNHWSIRKLLRGDQNEEDGETVVG